MPNKILLTCVILISNLSLSFSQEYKLPLGPKTDLVNLISAQGQNKNSDQWALFSHNDNTLMIYNLDSREIEKKITYPKQGPNKLNNMHIYGAMHWVNEDTIVYFDTQINKLYLGNLAGDIYKASLLEAGASGFGSLSTKKSMAYRQGKIYMQSWPVTIGQNMVKNPEKVPNKIVEISLKDQTHKEFVFDFPDEYKQDKYGQGLKNINIIYHKQLDKFVVNFPLASALYITDFKGDTRTIIAKSELVKEAVGLSEVKGKTELSRQGDMARWMSDNYEQLIYDSESGYTIRVARKGISERAYLNREWDLKREALVFDKNLKLTRTFEVKTGSLLYWFFKDGYFFYNKDITEYNFETGNEDELFFSRVKLN